MFFKCLVTQSCPTLCDHMDCSHQAPLSMEISRQEYWSGSPCPPPGNLPNPEIKPRSPALQVDFFFIFYYLSHQGRQRILEWVAYPVSWGNFLTQELNQGLLNCRFINYQLSYQSIPGANGKFFQEGRSNESSKEPEPVPSTSGMSEISASIYYC